jgi:S-adenosylmethionine:diacylglycerol 3-amino-3-carboxypropyl transferase
MPPYLREERVHDLKTALVKSDIHLVQMDIVDYLASTGEVFDAFSLSDCISYMGEDRLRALLAGILRRGKTGSRFIFRQFLTTHVIPEEFAPYFVRDPILEETLEREDTSLIYTFMAGTMQT